MPSPPEIDVNVSVENYAAIPNPHAIKTTRTTIGSAWLTVDLPFLPGTSIASRYP
jgi:hypothetical protein